MWLFLELAACMLPGIVLLILVWRI